MQHVVGAKQTKRQWLDVTFVFDLQMDFPEVGYEVVDRNQPGGREEGVSVSMHYTLEIAIRYART